MIFIKKINEAKDLELVKQQDPEAEKHIWVLISNSEKAKPFFAPMVPMNESELNRTLLFFRDKKDTVWKGGYYISEKKFDLTFDGTIRHEDSPKPLLTTLGVHVLGLDVNQDMTELISWLAGKDELNAEEIDTKLASRKKAFFADLERRLYQPGYRDELSSSQDINDQIQALAADCMLKAFPWLNVEITFANTEAILSESEKEFKKSCDDLAAKQRQMTMELQQKQTEHAHKVTLMEMQQSEKEVMFAAELREQERLLALEAKEQEMRILKGVEQERLEKEKAQLRAERKEIEDTLVHKQELRRLELMKAEYEVSADAEERAKRLEVIEIEKQIKENELNLLKQKVEYSKEYRAAKLEASKQDSAHLTAMQNQLRKSEELLSAVLEELRRKLTTAVVSLDMPTCKTTLARKISAQKSVNSISLKRENVSLGRGISFVGAIEIDTIKIGTAMSFKFRSPVSGYFNLFCSESGGGFTVLVPNFADQQIYVEAGKEYEFPAQTSMLYRKVAQVGPAGNESVWAAITPQPLTSVPAGLNDEDLKLLPNEIDNIIKKLESFPANVWAADSIAYVIR